MNLNSFSGRIVVPIVLVISAFVAFTGCSSNPQKTPGDLLVSYYTAIQEQNFEDACAKWDAYLLSRIGGVEGCIVYLPSEYPPGSIPAGKVEVQDWEKVLDECLSGLGVYWDGDGLTFDGQPASTGDSFCIYQVDGLWYLGAVS